MKTEREKECIACSYSMQLSAIGPLFTCKVWIKTVFVLQLLCWCGPYLLNNERLYYLKRRLEGAQASPVKSAGPQELAKVQRHEQHEEEKEEEKRRKRAERQSVQSIVMFGMADRLIETMGHSASASRHNNSHDRLVNKWRCDAMKVNHETRCSRRIKQATVREDELTRVIGDTKRCAKSSISVSLWWLMCRWTCSLSLLSQVELALLTDAMRYHPQIKLVVSVEWPSLDLPPG